MDHSIANSKKITLKKIHCRVVSVPLPRTIVGKVGRFTHWPLILIDLETKEGVVGRCYLEPYVEKLTRPIVGVVEELFGMFEGKTIGPFDLYEGAMKTLHLDGREGITIIALSGLDMAVWDALAKSVDLPMVSLLGGSPGDIRAYNTNGLWLNPIDKLGREAKDLIDQGGFKALKLRLGRPTAAQDKEAIRTVREAVGDDVHIMTDFNQGFTLAEALQRMHYLDNEGLYWFEEPIAYDDFYNYAQITREIKTPIQIGENIYGSRTFLKAVMCRAADMYMPDLMRIGGVTGWLRAAAIAGAAGLPLSSHLYPRVSAQLLRVSESADWLEWSDWAEAILAEPFTVKDGIATVPNTPGNSIDWDEAAIKKYQI